MCEKCNFSHFFLHSSSAPYIVMIFHTFAKALKLVVAIIAVVFGYIPVSLGVNVWVTLAIGTASIWGILRFYGKSVKNLKPVN